MSSKRWRRAGEKESPGEVSPIKAEEQEIIEEHDAINIDDGFFDDVDEPMSDQREDPVENPYVPEASVPSKNLVSGYSK
jgi:hypothetical protein